MKILHYSLGFPPYRSGGLTKFCMDIMQEEKRIGHDVSMLWPGEIKLIRKDVLIKGRGQQQGIQSWEIINPLPVSYDEGIVDIEAFTAPCDKAVFVKFLKVAAPDVIHIHTFMGLHSEFVEAAKELGIKTVFSVHDFFAVCPKVTMYRNDAVCVHADNCGDCPQCNLTALSMKKIKILQSPLYRELKDSYVSKKLRKRHRDQYLSGNAEKEVKSTVGAHRSAEDYKSLRAYYGRMISSVDMVHYNSSVTKSVFERFFIPSDSRVISISHADIKDNRKTKNFGKRLRNELCNELRLTYLGPAGGAKGFFVLRRRSMIYG